VSRKIDTNPRKHASQQRSRLTVEVILEATTRVLIKDGYDRASTNRIAAAAGISIGSLYQYFPGKEALVAAVSERHSQEVLELMRGALARVRASPIETALRELVSVAIDAHRVNPKLHRVLAEQVPRIGRLKNVESINESVFELVAHYLEEHRGELDVPDLDIAAFLCFTAVDALTHVAVLRRPDMLAGEKTEMFVNEVTSLVARYLKPRSSCQGTRRSPARTKTSSKSGS
jgi:AcrR family transcriptional regulator